MSVTSTFPWPIDNNVYPAGQAILQGQVVQNESGATLLLGSSGTTATNQATAEVEIPLGVAVADCASGVTPTVVSQHGAQVLVRVSTNSNGIVEGEYVAIEYNTGDVLGVDSDSLTIAAGDWLLGLVKIGGSADGYALITWNPRKFEDTDT